MKRNLILLMAAMMLPLALIAQMKMASPLRAINHLQHRAATGRMAVDDTHLILGHYDTDAIATQGTSMLNSGLVPVAIMLEPDELDIFEGGKIVAFRIGLVESAQVARVFAIPVTAKGKYGTKTEWLCDVSDAGWNEVVLETPYEINIEEGGKLLIGFYYKQEDGCNPISLVNVGTPSDTYTYAKVGSSAKWKALGWTDSGNLSLQCVVESDNFPDYKIILNDMRGENYVKAGKKMDYAMTIKNRGIRPIDTGTMAVNVLVDGELVDVVTNNSPFENGYYNLNGTISTAALASGEHTLTLQAASVGGVELDPVSMDWPFKVYQRDFPRQKHLVEQLTSTYCTYCPLGNSMLNILTAQRDDIIWVAVHGNLGSGVDPYRSNQGDTIMGYLTGGSVSYPSAAFDRATGWNDDVSIVNSIGYYEQYHQMAADYVGYFFDEISEAMPTFAEIRGGCYVNEDTRHATVSIYGHYSPDFDLMMGEDATLTVYLVEDSLVAAQLNNGTWINKYVHNGVFRQALGSVFGVKPGLQEDYYKNTFSFTIPNAWDWTKMRVVAFISRPMRNALTGFTDLVVNNAADFKFEKSTGIDEAVIDADAVPVEYYDLMGRRHDTPQQGINIVRMSDGSTYKILAK